MAFSRQERERHLYIVGKSGSGKSTVLFNLAMADIMAGEGVAVIDPHGDQPKRSSTRFRRSGPTRSVTSSSPIPTIRCGSTRWPACRPIGGR